MPTPGTQRTAIRIEPELWERFGEVAGNRSQILRDFIRWYVRDKNARMPKRPAEGITFVHDEIEQYR